MDELKNDIIEGRNAVLEALRAGRAIDKLYIARGETDRALGHIAGLARERGIAVSDCDRRKLDAMSVTKAHQGVIAVCALRSYASLDDILAVAAERGAPLRARGRGHAGEREPHGLFVQPGEPRLHPQRARGQ